MSNPPKKKRKKNIPRVKIVSRLLNRNQSIKIETKLQNFVDSYEIKKQYERERYEIAMDILNIKPIIVISGIENLPFDCIIEITKYMIDPKDILNFGITCKFITNIYVWETICKNKLSKLVRPKIYDKPNNYGKAENYGFGNDKLIDLTNDSDDDDDRIVNGIISLKYIRKMTHKRDMSLLISFNYVLMLYNKYGHWRDVLNDIHVEKTSLKKKQSCCVLEIFKEFISKEILDNKDLWSKNGKLFIKKSDDFAESLMSYKKRELKMAKDIAFSLNCIRESKISFPFFSSATFEKNIKLEKKIIQKRLGKKCQMDECENLIEYDWNTCSKCDIEVCNSCFPFCLYCFICSNHICPKCSKDFGNWCFDCDKNKYIY